MLSKRRGLVYLTEKLFWVTSDGNPKERDTHFYLRFFQNNLADPKIASTNLLKYVTPIVSILNLI